MSIQHGMFPMGSQLCIRQNLLGFLKASRRELDFHGGKQHQEQLETSMEVISPSKYSQIHEIR